MEASDRLRALQTDLEFAAEDRRHRESAWSEYWRRYLVQAKKRKLKNRSNAVSPHGGMLIRDLVPQCKRLILSTHPFIRAQANKRELRELEPLIDTVIAYWTELADIRHRVLTVMLKEALIFGGAFAFVDHVENGRLLRRDDMEPEAWASLAYNAGAADPEEASELTEILYRGPRVTPIAVEDSLPDPTAGDVEDMRFFAWRTWRTISELVEDGRYDADKLEEIQKSQSRGYGGLRVDLESIFADRRRRILGLPLDKFRELASKQAAKGDPLVELVQYVSNKGEFFAIADGRDIIREVTLDHPFPVFGIIPDPIPFEVWGKSVFHDVVPTLDQRDFLINKGFEAVKASVDKTFLAVAGQVSRNALRSRQDGVIWVNDINAMKELQESRLGGEVFGFISQLDREFERGSGLGEPLQSVGGAGAIYNETATTTLRREHHAMGPIQEMVQNIERGLSRMAKIILDIEAERWTGEDWIRVAGEEGARFYHVDWDRVSSDFDFRLIGSQYALNKQTQADALFAIVDRLLAINNAEPGRIDTGVLARMLVEVTGLPGVRDLVRGEGRDLGPDAEHRVMRQGMRVHVEEDEDVEKHLQAHMEERERAVAEGEDERYIARLEEHLEATISLYQRIAAAREAANGAIPA